jgi:hypothetical protein
MTTNTLRRWGAILLTGGLCLAVSYSFFPSTPHSSRLQLCAALALVGILIALPSLFAYQRGQSPKARVNGWIGTAITVVALSLLEIPHLVIALVSRSTLDDLDAYHSGVWGSLEFLGLGLLPIGLIVLAVATRRSDTYPRWAFWALIANVVVGGIGAVGPVGTAIHTPAPNYLLMGLVGLAMIQLARTRAESGHGVAADHTDPALSATR